MRRSSEIITSKKTTSTTIFVHEFIGKSVFSGVYANGPSKEFNHFTKSERPRGTNGEGVPTLEP